MGDTGEPEEPESLARACRWIVSDTAEPEFLDARREESAWGEMQPLRRAIAEALELPAWAAALGQPASVRLTQPPAEDAGRQGSVASCMANEWTEWLTLPLDVRGQGQAAPLEDGDNGRQESMPSCGGGCGDAERSLSGAQASTNPAAMDEDTQAGGGAGAPSRLGHIGRSVRQLPPKQQAWLAQWVVCAVHGHVTQASSEGPPQAVLRGSPELAWVLTGEAAAASPGAHGAGNGEATSAASNGAPGAQARRDGGVGGGWERPWGEAEGAREAARGLSGAQMRLLWLLLGECFAQPQLVRLLLWEVLAGDAAALTALRGEDRVVAALGLVPALLSVLVQRALNVATATAAGDSNANGKEPILPPHARKVLAYARTLLWQYAALERVADWRRLIGKSRAMPALATEVMEAGKPGEAWRTSAEEVAKQLAKEGGSEVDARHMVQALVESIAECILSETGAGRAHRLVELHLALLLSYTHHLVPSTKPGTSQPKAGVVGVLGSWEWSQQTLLAVALAAGGPSGSSRAAAAAAALVVLAVAEGVVGLAEAVRQLLPARASRMEPLWARLLLGRRGAQALPPEIDLAAPTWGALWRLQHGLPLDVVLERVRKLVAAAAAEAGSGEEEAGASWHAAADVLENPAVRGVCLQDPATLAYELNRVLDPHEVPGGVGSGSKGGGSQAILQALADGRLAPPGRAVPGPGRMVGHVLEGLSAAAVPWQCLQLQQYTSAGGVKEAAVMRGLGTAGGGAGGGGGWVPFVALLKAALRGRPAMGALLSDVVARYEPAAGPTASKQ
eukprot:gene9630-11411_t